ncbi:ABC transporter ATP-binding protein [Corynebacterium vitaeruminis]|uniref:ABC transporter ATP-binding protein n=1 Tax=Corynebacterium vitaeruminis TaxID=38305 RepID=UPI0005517E8E|nr:ABC transporter ATP-binding protein [Corynebacterium vitaeruminis]
MNLVLSLRDVSVVYPDGTSTVTALDNASLELLPGQLTAVVGESGSGKSTLLSVAGALVTPTSGEVEVAGIPVHDASEKTRTAIRRDHIGVVFQSPNLLGSLTAREQLLITDHIRGLRRGRLKARAERADELLEKVGLKGFCNRRTAELSGGQRQRVNIARALMGSPELLLADEPTSALDQRLSREIVELLRRVTDEFGVATMMITHDRSQLAAADQVVEMVDGRPRVLDKLPAA